MGIMGGEVRKTCSGKTYIGPYIPNMSVRSGRLIFSNFEYVGQVKRIGKLYFMNGEGTFTLNGITYEGRYEVDKFEGPLKVTKGGVVILEGIFQESRFISGYYIANDDSIIYSNSFNSYNVYFYGNIVRPNCDVFNGKFRKICDEFIKGSIIEVFGDVEYKEGVLNKENGTIIDGEWISYRWVGENRVDADVEIKYTNGDIYKGTLRNVNEYNENEYFIGKLTKADGTIFDGQWTHNVFFGKVKYPNGDFYNGYCKGGKRNGQGKLTILNGETYVCNWINDRKNGNGSVIFKKIQTQFFWNNDTEIQKEKPLNIKCPKCRKNISFLLSECKMYEENIKQDNICCICFENICNTNLPCQHQFCLNCVKLIK